MGLVYNDSSKSKWKNWPLAAVFLMCAGILAIIFLVLVIFSGRETVRLIKLTKNSPQQIAVIKINQQEIKAEIAATFKQQYQGLSNRESLCGDCGMLFNFSDSGPRSFVMRNMNFPLDIIFIDNGVIKNIAAQLEPEKENPQNIYESNGPVNQVLEVNGGYCDKYNIQPGDRVDIDFER